MPAESVDEQIEVCGAGIIRGLAAGYPGSLVTYPRLGTKAGGGLRFGILGTVEVTTVGGPVTLGRPRQRVLLAYLLLHSNQLVTIDQVVEALWGGAEPASARAQVHVAMSRLRGALRGHGLAEMILTRPGGYQVAVADDDVDVGVFRREIAAARRAADRSEPAETARRSRAALGLWRDTPLADVSAPFVPPVRQQLCEQRLSAIELLTAADLKLGRHDEVIPDLQALVEQHPYRERLAGYLMLAQYRAGRRSDALETARQLRAALVEQHGLDPGKPFVALERAILNADSGLDRETPDADWNPAGTSGAPPSAPPAQLPRQPAGFAGRGRELELLTAAAGAGGPSPALIVGSAGVGKTALALHWAHGHKDRFPDGQMFVDMRGYDPDRPAMDPVEALRRFLRALRVDPAEIPDDADEAAALYRSRLAGRRMVIVLDNVRSPHQVRPLLPGAGPCAVLVTSRSQLRPLVAHEGAQPVPLDPLPEAEAVSLLGRAISGRAGDPSEASDQWAQLAEIARLCAYLPLALRLVAAQLAYRRELTVADYLRQLSAGNPLSVLDSEGEPGGGVSLAFAMSYRTLLPMARRLFRLLSLVPGHDFSDAAAAALLKTTRSEVRGPIEELCVAHLMTEHRDSRYGMHDLLRSYAAAMLTEEEPATGRTEAVRRLVDFYAETVFAAYPVLQPRRSEGDRDIVYAAPDPLRFSDRQAALAWHDQERDNLVGVVELAARHGWHRSAWQLTNDLLAYFVIRRRWPEWLAAVRIGTASAAQCRDLAALAHMANALGMINKQTGRYAAAHHHYERAIRLATAAGRRRMTGSFHANVGGLCITEGDLAAGVRYLRAALAIPEYGERPEFAVSAYINLGCALIEMGEYADATEALDRALTFAMSVDDVQNVCIAYHNLAEISLREGDHGHARKLAQWELQLAQSLGDPLRTAGALDILGSAIAPRDLPDARGKWEAAGTIYRQLGHRLSAELDEWLGVIDTVADPAELAEADERRRFRARRLL